MEYGTIKIPEVAYEHHNERRQELGLTWEEYIEGEAPAAGVDADDLAEAVAERVDAPDTVSLEAAERQRIAEEVAEVLR